MPGTPTPNYGLYIGTVGGDTGTWGGFVNTNLTTFLDSFLGNMLGVSITVADVTLTLSQWQNNAIFKLTGALTGNRNLILPFNGATGAGTAVGGKFIVDNQCSGNFTVTAKTVAAGSVGVVVAQGSRTLLYSDQTNVLYAQDSRGSKVNPNAGNPNGSVTGNAGNPANMQGTDIIYDVTNQQLYVSLGSGGGAGTSGTAWSAIGVNLPTPQGYVTPVTVTPVITADATAITTIFYTPYKGNLIPIYNGSSFAIVPFAELSLALSAGSQASNNLYDIFIFLNAGVVTAAFGPSWLSGAGGGNVTPGSCARGTGAGSTALQRISGIFTNTVEIPAANNGASTFDILANRGTYVATVAIGATAGQVNLFRSYGGGTTAGPGTARRWDIWNAYNRVPIIMRAGDSSTTAGAAGTPTALPTFRFTQTQNQGWAQLNGAGSTSPNLNPNSNLIVALCGLAEEEIDATYNQVAIPSNALWTAGIGFNSTSSPSGFYGQGNVPLTLTQPIQARAVQPPSLGLTNVFPMLFNPGGSGNTSSVYTQENACLLTTRYMG